MLVEKPARAHRGRNRSIDRRGTHAQPARPGRLQPSLSSGAARGARAIVDAGALGPLMFIRGRYGHGGRVGYDREWRADPAKSGGGELIDQGVHLIDLAAWFLGDFSDVRGAAATYFWDMPVDDNAFMLLTATRRPDRVPPRELHGMEEPLFARDLRPRGKDCHRRPRRQLRRRTVHALPHAARTGPARDDDARNTRRGDRSWALEFSEFLEDIRLGREPAAGLDARPSGAVRRRTDLRAVGLS